MLATLLLAATAGAIDLPTPPQLPDQPTPQIWQGEEVVDPGLEAVVGLRAATQSGSGVSDTFCSGTLIDPSWVITAAHCLTVAEDAKSHGYRIEVVFGGDAPYRERAVADRLIAHPDYDAAAGAGTGQDVALVHLAQPVTDVTPIPPSNVALDDAWVGLPVAVVGYGMTNDGAGDTGTQRRADLTYVTTSSDLLQLTSGSVRFDDRTGTYDIVGGDSSTNACNGDSGGASVVQLDSGDWVLVGVTVVVYGGCESGSTGSTAVADYVDWIRGEIAGLDVSAHPRRDEVTLIDPEEALPSVATHGTPYSAASAPSGCAVGGGAGGLLATALALLARRRGGRRSARGRSGRLR